VATDPAPELDRLTVVRPSRFLVALLGRTGARLTTFAWCAVTLRPEVLVGFHLLVNGMLAIVLACLLGRRSVYFCGGGQTEVLDGGAWGENRLFGRLPGPDAFIERALLRCVGLCDVVVTMGTGAARFLRDRGVRTRIEVLPGGHRLVHRDRSSRRATWDCVFVGRLAAVKRVDRLLEALCLARREVPTLTAVVVGDGPLRAELEAKARQLGIEGAVTFVGQQDAVDRWLSKSRLLVLTSDSEGVPQAVIEGFAHGLPAVASDVGDVSDIVTDGVNGCLVARREPSEFARRIVSLLGDPERMRGFGARAVDTAARFDLVAVSRQWDGILSSFAPAADWGHLPDSGEGIK
jgi:glycosyltransferase involved in cell wall biosynthesis